jgi:hypothetical protein
MPFAWFHAGLCPQRLGTGRLSAGRAWLCAADPVPMRGWRISPAFLAMRGDPNMPLGRCTAFPDRLLARESSAKSLRSISARRGAPRFEACSTDRYRGRFLTKCDSCNRSLRLSERHQCEHIRRICIQAAEHYIGRSSAPAVRRQTRALGQPRRRGTFGWVLGVLGGLGGEQPCLACPD